MDLPTGLPQKLQRHLEPTDNDNDDADIVENNLLYQMVGLVGWLVLTISILLLFWASEPVYLELLLGGRHLRNVCSRLATLRHSFQDCRSL